MDKKISMIERRLLLYIDENPLASDTADGIARWWVRMPVGEVMPCLESLVKRGVLEKSERADSIHYSKPSNPVHIQDAGGKIQFPQISSKGSKEKPILSGNIAAGKDKKKKISFGKSQILTEKENKTTSRALQVNSKMDEVKRYYKKLHQETNELKDRIINNQEIDPLPILSDLHHIISHNLIDDLYALAMGDPYSHGEGLTAHGIDVTCASLKVGKGMGYNLRRLLRLGMAAFFENVATYKIPTNILEKEGKLEKEEWAVIRNHPRESFKILSRLGDRYKWLAEVALQTHERWDGSGYPIGLRGEDISELALIIGVVDTYTALIKERPYRVKSIRCEAVKEIINIKKNGLFPSKVVKAFLNQITPFPVNSLVKLNNNSIVRVVETDYRQPLKPTVQLCYDGLGRMVEKKEIIRLTDNHLYIVEAIDE